jgi:hypothetical protein
VIPAGMLHGPDSVRASPVEVPAGLLAARDCTDLPHLREAARVLDGKGMPPHCPCAI